MPDLLSRLPQSLQTVVSVAKSVARDSSQKLYMIGGPVRDLLLGQSVTDLDLTVEGDAEPLTKDVAQRLGARVKSFPRFLTFKLILPDDGEIDVTTTRSEHYSAPGALPEVAHGSLGDDLRRRDFSINAIALDLVTNEIHDETGGRDDLNRKLLRILHPASFIDDPTRILRALRFASRLSFTLEARTESLLVAALRTHQLKTVSRERLWREIDRAIHEASPAAVLRRFEKYGILESLLRTTLTQQAGELELLEAALREWPDADPVVSFLALLVPSPFDAHLLEGSGLSSKRQRELATILATSGERMEAARAAPTARERLSILEGASEEMLALLYARSAELRPALRTLREARSLHLQFTGADLGVPPGPHIGVAMREVRRALTLGEISPSESLAFARQKALAYLEMCSSPRGSGPEQA